MIKAVLGAFIVVGGLVLTSSLAVSLARLDSHASAASVDTCQRYADAAEKELTKSLDALGSVWMNVSTQRAQAWAFLYIGCRRAQ